MSVIITLLIAIAGISSDPISGAIENYSNVGSYKVTLISETAGSKMTIRYFYKKPGFVKMEFIKPFSGAVLVYNPHTNKVKVKPFKSIDFLYFVLDPNNEFIKSSSGHSIDKSDIGELLKSVRKLQENGETEILGEDYVDGREVIRLRVKGKGNYVFNGIHSYNLWLEKTNLLPLKVSSFDIGDKPVEEVLMDDLQIDTLLPDTFFDL